MTTPLSDRAAQDPLALLRWQFDLTWSLFEYHLERLEPDDFLWESTANCWTMRPGQGGGWTPDWADVEPAIVPVPTIGWLSWHLGWWWSVAIDHARGRIPRDRADISWPGPGAATIEWLRGMHAEWTNVLDTLGAEDLERTATFPWQEESRHSVAHMVAWVNSELMKNVAEIGQLRLLRAADGK